MKETTTSFRGSRDFITSAQEEGKTYWVFGRKPEDARKLAQPAPGRSLGERQRP